MVEQSLGSAVLDPPKERWDYYVMSIHARNDLALQEKLQMLGREGWELVAMDTPIAMEYHCIFKRRL
jgi:hypothetical protein